MISIAELPSEVISLLQENEAGVLAWASETHYAALVEQQSGHLLVRIKAGFDFSALEKGCAGFHLYAGQRGQAATHSLGQLCCGLVVKALNHWSYRQTAREVASNSLLRWFVGYTLPEATFSASTLQRFGVWVMTHQSRLFFNAVLKQIDEDFPAEAQAAQVGDTFVLHSRAQEQSRIVMLRCACKTVLQRLATVTSAGHGPVLAALDGSQLFGSEDEKAEYWLEKADRQAREIRTALGAQHCLTLVQAQVAQLGELKTIEFAALQHRTKLLAKILADYFVLTVAADQTVTCTLRTESVKGSYRIGSTVDEAATFRQHGEHADLGYNINVSATTNFVREINAVTGATPDSVGVAPLVANQKAQLGLVPPKIIYDRAAGMPKIFAAPKGHPAKASDDKTQLVARLIHYGKNKERFGPGDFTFNELGHLRCPNGQTTNRAYRSGSCDGLNYRFTADQCQGCPLLDKCRDPKSKPNSHRNVFVSDYAHQQRLALAYTQTDAFKADMKLRPHIERTIACLTRYNGARYATAYGQKNADFQVRMSALAFNLKRWHVLTRKKEAPPAEPWD